MDNTTVAVRTPNPAKRILPPHPLRAAVVITAFTARAASSGGSFVLDATSVTSSALFMLERPAMPSERASL